MLVKLTMEEIITHLVVVRASNQNKRIETTDGKHRETTFSSFGRYFFLVASFALIYNSTNATEVKLKRIRSN